MAEGTIDRKVDGGVMRLEINHAPVNSYTHEMLRQLDDALLEARFNESVHAILITGNGEKFFSAGADITMLGSKTVAYKYNFALHGHEVLTRMENTPKLVIAALNGHAIGGGLEIAMAADIRIAKKDAGRVGLAEVNLGVMPGMGGTQRLPRLVGRAKALELCATGKQIAFAILSRKMSWTTLDSSCRRIRRVSRWVKSSAQSMPVWSHPWQRGWHSNVKFFTRPSQVRTATKV
jgi:enoyl-CoA hydratase